MILSLANNIICNFLGTDLTRRFRDQFSPMLINENELWSSSDSTIIRMPLSSEFLKDGSNRLREIIDKFMEHGSRSLLLLKSVLQVNIRSAVLDIFRAFYHSRLEIYIKIIESSHNSSSF